ncbi:MAG: hypothetical protein R6U96_03995 [Promethearchaeia archaeon]
MIFALLVTEEWGTYRKKLNQMVVAFQARDAEELERIESHGLDLDFIKIKN